MEAMTKELQQSQKLTHKAINQMTGIQDDFLHLSNNMEKQIDIIQRSFASFRQFQTDQLEERLGDLKDEIKSLLATQTSMTQTSPSTKRNRKATSTTEMPHSHPNSPSQPPQLKRLHTQRNHSQAGNTEPAATSREPTLTQNRYLQLSLTEDSDSDEETSLPDMEEDDDSKSTSPGGQSE